VDRDDRRLVVLMHDHPQAVGQGEFLVRNRDAGAGRCVLRLRGGESSGADRGGEGQRKRALLQYGSWCGHWTLPCDCVCDGPEWAQRPILAAASDPGTRSQVLCRCRPRHPGLDWPDPAQETAMTPPSPRHCLVTGANRGLGLEFVRQLLERGDRVVATCRQPGRANDLNQLTGQYPGRLHVLPLDVAEPKSHAELVRELPLVLGDDAHRHLLINNAGVLHSRERCGRVAAATLDDSLRTNTPGPLLLTQAMAPLLADGGKVANLSSELGSIAGKDAFRTPRSSISKAALNMVTA